MKTTDIAPSTLTPVQRIYFDMLCKLRHFARATLQDPLFGEDLEDIATLKSHPLLDPELVDELQHYASTVLKHQRQPA